MRSKKRQDITMIFKQFIQMTFESFIDDLSVLMKEQLS